MRTKTIAITTHLQAGKSEIFQKLLKLETLQYIAAPYAKFIPVGGDQDIMWKEGSTFSFRFYLFGIIPFGIHTIRVLTSGEESGISTEEFNKHIPVWNHRIYLEAVDRDVTRYTDVVEIGAGWKTSFVALWAKAFYTHRQRKWRKLLAAARR